MQAYLLLDIYVTFLLNDFNIFKNIILFQIFYNNFLYHISFIEQILSIITLYINILVGHAGSSVGPLKDSRLADFC